MFAFNNVLDKDVTLYEYELYENDQVTGSYPNFSLVLNPTIYSTGTSGSNVFTIAVDNSTDIENIKYYGRVRTIDTSGNLSSWSPLVESEDTPLIADQFIANLTAAKITAGTIGAHQIILSQAGPQTNIAAPANMAILRSSDYNGSYNSNTSTWTNGSSGWIVAGDGHAEFSSASIRGGLKAESVYINEDNRWRRNNTDTAVSDEFKVGSSTKYLYFDGTDLTFTGNLSAAGGTFSGDLSAAGGTFSGALNGGTISIGSGNSIFKADTNGIYLGNSTFASAPFRVTPGGALTATNANITGTINATSGSISGNLVTGGTISGTSINIGSGTFQVTSSGALTSSSANITGTINSTSGSIAGWNIGSNLISAAGGDIALYQETGYGAVIAGSGAAEQIILNSDAELYAISQGIETTLNAPFIFGGNYFTFIVKQANDPIVSTRIKPALAVLTTADNQITLSAFDGISTNLDISAGGQIQANTFYADDSITATTLNTLYMNPNGDDTIYVLSGDGFAYYGVNFGPGNPNTVGFLWDFPNLHGVVDNAASMVIGSLSDIRSKSEITNANENWINKLLSEVRVVEFIPVNPFEWDEKAKKSEEKPKRLGIIAQELKETMPHLVTGGKNAEDLLSVDYMGLIPHIVQSLQNIDQRLKQIEKVKL
jgi:hypothetical protein